QARQELDVIDASAPLAGVPTLTKDLLIALAGEPLASGSEALRDFRPAQDANLVTRMRASGLVILGQTVTPELGLMGITEPKAFSHPRNPWQTSHSPGGSSGGSAVAVAAGMVPFAMASDGGGSIRIPASYCGLFGLKPSRGRMPAGPLEGPPWHGASLDFALTRSVRDAAALLDALNGVDEGALYGVPKERGFSSALDQELPRLRIAVSLGSALSRSLGTRLSAQVVQAVEQAAAELEALGHRVEWVEPPVDGALVAHCYLTLYLGQVVAVLEQLSRQLGKPVRQLAIEPATRALYRMGRALPAGDYLRRLNDWNTLARQMGVFHRRHDVLLMPTTAGAAPQLGELYPSRTRERLMTQLAIPGLAGLALKADVLNTLARDALKATPFTQLANLTGQPAMSVPWGSSDRQLPVGVQFVAPLHGERQLLQLAAELEQARPWMPALERVFHRLA
ncbi:MAG TPA: amidase family protein, partial [Halomonas sp.]|nr:amidase family protein [Halomonas sp.]